MISASRASCYFAELTEILVTDVIIRQTSIFLSKPNIKTAYINCDSFKRLVLYNCERIFIKFINVKVSEFFALEHTSSILKHKFFVCGKKVTYAEKIKLTMPRSMSVNFFYQKSRKAETREKGRVTTVMSRRRESIKSADSVAATALLCVCV